MDDRGDRPGHAGDETSQAKLAVLAVGLVVPGYLLIGWLVAQFMGSEPLLDEAYRFPFFASGCGIGLASALYSLRLARPGEGGRFLVALGMAELPALCGLGYFIVYRDPVGFAILLVVTALAFIAQAWRAKATLSRP